MGMIASGIRGEEIDSENDPKEREERYEKLYMKIARDFVHKDDFHRTMRSLIHQMMLSMGVMAPALLSIDYESDEGALRRGQEYKDLLDSGKDGSMIYKDLIDLED